MDLTEVGRRFDEVSIGTHRPQEAMDAGRGGIIALPHSGNWDMAGVWLVYKHGTFSTVAERLKPESLYNRFIAYRESLGFEVFPASGGERPPFELLAERLRENKMVCLMADRDLTRSGVEVDFFGERTRLPAGPAKLAITTGAHLIPAHVYYRGDDCIIDLQEPLDTSSKDVTAVTQALADRFARNIAAHPADWHMMQPQWLADLSEERRAKIGAT
jgi:KDO2-lipid IV(A) lauroyltransferase